MPKNTENELGRLILKLANTIVKNRNRHLEALDLTSGQADSLQFFLTHDQATATELKEYLGITHQTARGIIQRMITKGLLELHRSDADARCQIVEVTPAGQEMGLRMIANRERTGGLLLQGMDATERKNFIRLLTKALANVSDDR